jgi:hypothetical protein
VHREEDDRLAVCLGELGPVLRDDRGVRLLVLAAVVLEGPEEVLHGVRPPLQKAPRHRPRSFVFDDHSDVQHLCASCALGASDPGDDDPNERDRHHDGWDGDPEECSLSHETAGLREDVQPDTEDEDVHAHLNPAGNHTGPREEVSEIRQQEEREPGDARHEHQPHQSQILIVQLTLLSGLRLIYIIAYYIVFCQ